MTSYSSRTFTIHAITRDIIQRESSSFPLRDVSRSRRATGTVALGYRDDACTVRGWVVGTLHVKTNKLFPIIAARQW